MAVEVGAAYVELSARTASLEAGLARANAKLVAFSKQADGTSARGSAALSAMGRGAKLAGLAVAGGLALAVKSAASFDAQMSQVKAVTNATGRQMDALRTSALKVSASTAGFGYTAKEVAQAQTELGKAGLSVAQIMGGGMKAALTLAKAGNLQLGDAAAYTANAMAQFNMAGSQAGSVADAMATAANATTADVGDFGAALVQTGAAAKSAGMSFNATMTALTALAKSGVKGSDAGTSLKTSLIQLLKPTDQQAQAAAKAGISFLDQNKNMRSLSDISAQLIAKTSRMTQAQRTALFATLAGTDGVRTLLALYNAGPATLDKYSAQLAKSGSATQMAATMNDNAAGRFKQLMATLQSAGIQIGDALLPPLVMLAQAFAAVISKVTAFKPIAYAAAAALGVLLAAMAVNKVVAFGGAIAEAASHVAKLGAVKAGVAAFGTAMDAGATKSTALKTALSAFGAGLPFGPLGLLAGAAAAGAAGLLIFGERTNSAAARQAFFAQSSNTATAAINGTTAALNGQISAMLGLNGSNVTAAQSRAAATAAEKAYNSALAAGRGPGESAAQYVQRLDGLRRNMVRTSQQASMAEQANIGQVNKGRQSVDQMVAATTKGINAQKQHIATLRQGLAPQNQWTMSAKEREKLALDITAAEGKLGAMEAKRPGIIRNTIAALQQYKKDVKASAASDGEKAAAVRAADQGIAKLKGQLQATGKVKVDPKVKVATEEPQRRINELRQAMGLLDGKTVNATVNVKVNKSGPTVERASGGYIQGFAGGGMVRGPGGKDRVPAMLTAGEVVLTRRQQALVNAGMSIDNALRRTGGAFAKGGFVKPRRKKNEKDDAYNKRVEAARARWEKANQDVRTAAGGVGQAITTVALKQFDAQSAKALAGMQAESAGRMASITRTYQGGVVKIDGAWTRITGTLETADKTQATALKSIEDKYAGLFTNLDNEFKTKGAALKAQFDALTPAEAQLKALTDAANQADLAGAVSDAQAKLREAQDFGDPAAIAAARKAVDDAVRAQTIAGLQQTAEAERAQRETDRATAEAEQQAEYDRRKTALQTALDGELEAQRIAGETSRMILEAKLAEEQAAEEAALATKQATYEQDRENERVRLEARLAAMTAHFEAVRKMGVGKTKGMITRLNNLATDFLASGRNLGDNFADGLKAVLPRIGNVADALADIIAKYLKTGSPTEKGPMSDLDHWWDGFVPALEQGLDAPALASTISAASTPGPGGGAGGGRTQVINLTVTDQTFAGMSREQADRVAREIQAALDRQVRAAI